MVASARDVQGTGSKGVHQGNKCNDRVRAVVVWDTKENITVVCVIRAPKKPKGGFFLLVEKEKVCGRKRTFLLV